jgi:hypothetical protein
MLQYHKNNKSYIMGLMHLQYVWTYEYHIYLRLCYILNVISLNFKFQ